MLLLYFSIIYSPMNQLSLKIKNYNKLSFFYFSNLKRFRKTLFMFLKYYLTTSVNYIDLHFYINQTPASTSILINNYKNYFI